MGNLNQESKKSKTVTMGNLNQESKNTAALRYAARNGRLDIVKYLVEKCKVNVHTDNDHALHLATRYGQLNIVKYLIEEIKEVYFYFFIYWAPYYGQLNIVKYLVEDCEAKLNEVKFALYIATRSGHLNIVNYLYVMIKRKTVVNISKNKNELDECCICLDKKMKNIKFESCTHQCCEDCFMKMKETNLKCHLCRRKITSHHEIHITLLK